MDSSSDSRSSPTPRKNPKSPGQRRRAPPPPPSTATPPTTAPPPPPFTPPSAPTGSLTLQATRPGNMSNSLGQRSSSLSRHRSPVTGVKKTMGKSTSETQLRGGKPPTKPPSRPPPPQNKPRLDKTKSVVVGSSQKQHTKVRPLISNPQLISSTKNTNTLQSMPVTGKYRTLPSPPPAPEGGSHTRDEFDDDGPTDDGYTEVNFDPMPVPPPRRKRAKSKSTPGLSISKISPSPPSKGLSSQRRQTDNLLVQSRMARMRLVASPEPSRVPEDYLEPAPSVSSELRENEEDGSLDDYEDMRPGVSPETVTGKCVKKLFKAVY